jgi:alkylation response protein AidB-like acyl-CoA dehydrogenase
VKERKVLGEPLAAQAGVQAIVGDARFDLAGARAWLAQAVSALPNAGKGPPVPAWMAKVAVTETALRVIDRCLGLHGSAGYSRELPLDRMLRDARALSIHWGNNDVLRDTLRKMSLQ